MNIEKSIIFLLPLMPNIYDLKRELDNDSNYVVYEVDSVDEYKQIIGILEHVITFSSDLKKTNHYLEQTKHSIKRSTSLNCFIQDAPLTPQYLEKLTNNGIDEIFIKNTTLKTLKFKVETFFKKFDVKEQISNNSINEGNPVKVFKSTVDSNRILTNEKQHIERMALIDNKDGLNTKKRFKNYNFDNKPIRKQKGFQFNLPQDNFYKLKRSKINLPKREINFKKINLPTLDRPKVKRVNINNPLENRTHPKLMLSSESSNRKLKQLNLKNKELSFKRLYLNEFNNKNKRNKANILIDNKINHLAQKLEQKKHRDLDEYILDYLELKKIFSNKTKKNNINKDALDTLALCADEIAQTPDLKYFDSSSNMVEYFVLLEYFFSKASYEKFINFFKLLFYKHFKASVHFFVLKNTELHPLYDCDLDSSVLEQIRNVELPLWKDEKLITPSNEFVFPYYFNNKKLGYAYLYFKENLRSKAQMNLIEAFVMMAKAVVCKKDLEN